MIELCKELINKRVIIKFRDGNIFLGKDYVDAMIKNADNNFINIMPSKFEEDSKINIFYIPISSILYIGIIQ